MPKTHAQESQLKEQMVALGAHPNADLVILQSTVKAFRQGSERARQVTTVAGATSITVHCLFTNIKGQSLLERDVKGKVWFFGGNLKATNDFAKKACTCGARIIEGSKRTPRHTECLSVQAWQFSGFSEVFLADDWTRGSL